MIYIGIDPGKEGGIVGIDDMGAIEIKEIMPKDPMEVVEILDHYNRVNVPMFVYCEEAHPRPGNGVKSIHTFAFHNGQLDMILRFLKIPYELVFPGVWAREMHAGVTGDRPKERSRMAVQRLFPGVSLRNPDNPKARSMHEGLMDALLIAEYGRRKRSAKK